MREYIYTKTNSLSDEVCDSIIDYFESHTKEHHDGVVTDQFNNVRVAIQKKDTIDLNKSIIHVSNDSNWYPIQKILINKIRESVNEYSEFIDPNNDVYFFKEKFAKKCHLQTFLMQKYIKNKGKFTYHNDFGYSMYNRNYRLLNYLWYLNDVSEGGETEFFGDFTIKPEKGKLVIFPSEWFFPHTGKMPISNDKYIISGWIFVES